jgi:hypothetical protein
MIYVIAIHKISIIRQTARTIIDLIQISQRMIYISDISRKTSTHHSSINNQSTSTQQLSEDSFCNDLCHCSTQNHQQLMELVIRDLGLDVF